MIEKKINKKEVKAKKTTKPKINKKTSSKIKKLDFSKTEQKNSIDDLLKNKNVLKKKVAKRDVEISDKPKSLKETFLTKEEIERIEGNLDLDFVQSNDEMYQENDLYAENINKEKKLNSPTNVEKKEAVTEHAQNIKKDSMRSASKDEGNLEAKNMDGENENELSFDEKIEKEKEKIHQKIKKEIEEKLQKEKEEEVESHKKQILEKVSEKQKRFFKRNIIFAAVSLGIVLSGFAIKKTIEYYKNKDNIEQIKLHKEAEEEDRRNFLKKLNESGSLDAKSVGIFLVEKENQNSDNGLDVKKDNLKTLYLKNENEKVSLASVTKLMTAIVALENNDDKDIVITKRALFEEGDNSLLMNEKFSLDDLLTLTLMVSSNDGARAISEHFGRKDFIKKMNQKAEDLEMKKTIFFSESGLDSSSMVGGAYSTVLDLEKLVYYFYNKYPELARNSARSEKVIFSKNANHKAKNTNKLLEFDDNFILSKTGFTDLTGGNLVTAYTLPGKDILITIVLGSGRESRFDDVKKIIKAVKNYQKDKL